MPEEKKILVKKMNKKIGFSRIMHPDLKKSSVCE
jgi:hypothetical protein